MAGDTPCTGPAAIVLCQLLGRAGITCFVSPDPDTYTSSKGALRGRACACVQCNPCAPCPLPPLPAFLPLPGHGGHGRTLLLGDP